MSGGELRNGPLLQVKQLRKYYPFTKGVLFAKTLGQVKAVDDVSFGIDAGETLGLVGESGCGKTTTSKLILNLEEPSSGQVLLHGKPIHGLAGGALREYRARVQAVFQDPWSSLNPRMAIGRTIAESLIVTGWGNRADIADRVSELLDQVGLRRDHAISPRVQRRAAPAHRARQCLGLTTAADRARRAGFRPRRVDPSADDEPVEGHTGTEQRRLSAGRA